MIKRLRKIVLISGVSNSGKTTAIKLAMQKLGIHVEKPLKGDHLFVGYVNSGGAYYSCGIASGGDTPDVIKHNIEYFESVELQIAIIVMACKTRGGSLIAAEKFAKKHNVVPELLETTANPDSSKHDLHADALSDAICKLVC